VDACRGPAHADQHLLKKPEVFSMTASSIAFHLTTLATLAVAVVLIWGLSTLLRGNSPNLSQKLMRWRIGLQFIAILVIMMFVYLSRGMA
jgi:Hypoxia induced protein conserved region